MDKFRQSVAKLLMLWATLKGWQKLSILLAACGVFILLIFIVIWGSSQSYMPLFKGLDIGDQAAIVTYLKENKIPYRLESESNAILVPKNQLDDAKIGLAQANIPKSGIGYPELFPTTGFGRSEFELNIAYYRALEGEISRMLKQLEYVEDAFVNVVLPIQVLLLRYQLPSSASVLLKIRPGNRLNPEQVRAVFNHVSRSVPGLQVENISVSDNFGNIYTIDNEFYNEYGKHISQLQKDIARQQEKEYEKKIKELLEHNFGQGSVAVTVTIDLDFDKKIEKSKIFFPHGETGQGITRSEQKTIEEWNGIGTNPGGGPGTTTNTPGYAVSPGTLNSEYSKTDALINREISTQDTEKVIASGSIKRLTASVMINSEKLDGQPVNMYRALVASAIGLDESRGDILVVEAAPFSTEYEDYIKEQERIARFRSMVTSSIIGFVLFLLGSVLVVLWLKRRKAMLEMNKSSQEARHIPTIQEMLTSPDMIAAQGEISVLEEQIKAYARSNPKEVANLVNEWLSED
jgi:flagellar M-ring protein FliF